MRHASAKSEWVGGWLVGGRVGGWVGRLTNMANHLKEQEATFTQLNDQLARHESAVRENLDELAEVRMAEPVPGPTPQEAQQRATLAEANPTPKWAGAPAANAVTAAKKARADSKGREGGTQMDAAQGDAAL